MRDIDELQRRITAAMDRVAVGLDQLGTNSGGDSAAPGQALEEEKRANAQLAERVRVLSQRQEGELAVATQMAQDAKARMAELDAELAAFTNDLAEIDIRAAKPEVAADFEQLQSIIEERDLLLSKSEKTQKEYDVLFDQWMEQQS